MRESPRFVTPSRAEQALTASPERASQMWPGEWAEGSADHRQAVAALEHHPAPPLTVDRWLTEEPPDLEGSQTVLVFAVVWQPRQVELLRDLRIQIMRRADRGAQMVLIHPDEGVSDLEALLQGNLADVAVGIDSSHALREAYLVDSFPDFYLIGTDGQVLCADVANEHIIEALDAALGGWVPWETEGTDEESGGEGETP
ncbi:hypothetical protein JXA47_00670 [Candidatus Sumerlaeota bacterium]|nr:hypothetical protein [Candidatus Sumerlaeota bacterium]